MATKAKKLAGLKGALARTKDPEKKKALEQRIHKLEKPRKKPKATRKPKAAARKPARKAAARKPAHRKPAHRKTTRRAAARRRPKGVRRGPSAGRATASATVRVATTPASRRNDPGPRKHRRRGGGRGHRYAMMNPRGNWTNVAIMFGGMLGGYIVGGIGDALVATRTPTGGKHPWYGDDAATMVGTRMDGIRIVTGLVGAGLSIGISVWTGRRGWHKTSYMLAGLGLGWGLFVAVQLWWQYVVPKIFTVSKANEESFSNRYAAWAQDYVWKSTDDAAKALNDAAAKGANDPGYPAGQQEPIPDTAYPAIPTSLGAPKQLPQQTRAPLPRFPNMRPEVVQRAGIEQPRTIAQPQASEPAGIAAPVAAGVPTPAPRLNEYGHGLGCACSTCAPPSYEAEQVARTAAPQPPALAGAEDAFGARFHERMERKRRIAA